MPDAQADSRFKHFSLVAEFPKVWFYAGVPILTPDHQAVGTVCVMDYTPRWLAPEQADVLLMPAQQAGARLQLRGALAKIESLTSQYWDEFESRKRAEAALRTYAVTDELTGLYTLRGLQVVAGLFVRRNGKHRSLLGRTARTPVA